MTDNPQAPQGAPAAESNSPTLEGGNYEIIKARLSEAGAELRAKADALNEKRTAVFGKSELTVAGQSRLRTENNCLPRDVVTIGKRLFVGFSVHLGLRQEVAAADLFGLYDLVSTPEGFELPAVPTLGEARETAFLRDPAFTRDLSELYKYYKATQLMMVKRLGSRLLAIFQTGSSRFDIKAFRWELDGHHEPTYIDNRGERDFTAPPNHDFEWTATTRDNFVHGKHPHVSILDQVFVETVGGDLTIKVENNTTDGLGIYREAVEDPDQTLDQGQISYVKLGTLILLKILPFGEATWRYLVYNTLNRHVLRIDALGQCCRQLPEDHGIIFPGGFYLRTGEYKVFSQDTAGLELEQMLKSCNGEDVLYAFADPHAGKYLLVVYNLVRKELSAPIECQGYTLLDDGTLVVVRAAAAEPTKVHAVQLWKTPFMSPECAEAAPKADSYLGKIGNAELVRGISETLTLYQLIHNHKPTRESYEALIASTGRVINNYYWLGHAEAGDLLSTLENVRRTADLIIGEFEKVESLRQRAHEALSEAEARQVELVRRRRPEQLTSVAAVMENLTGLKTQRGHLITLKGVRFIELDRIATLEAEVSESYTATSKAAVTYLTKPEALAPLAAELAVLMHKGEQAPKAKELDILAESLATQVTGLELLSEVVGGLTGADATQRTQILEAIAEVFAQANRARAVFTNRRKELAGREGRAEFAAQFKLFSQSVAGALAAADTPERCEEQLSRLMVQVEEIEGRFSELDELLTELAGKREEVYEAFGAKKQSLLDQRQRRIETIVQAAERILEGVKRRGRGMKSEDELNTFFATDAMVQKLGDLADDLQKLGASVKHDELDSRIKAAGQEARRALRDRLDLYEDGDNIIKLGQHRFSVNTQTLELTLVPRNGIMCFHLTGTDFFEPVDDPAFMATRDYWEQALPSENAEVYRAEYLAATILRRAELGRDGFSLDGLAAAALEPEGLLSLLRPYATSHYEEGYERGIHDTDAAAILKQLLALRTTAGLLRFSPSSRGLAALYWAHHGDRPLAETLKRSAYHLGLIRTTLRQGAALADFTAGLATRVRDFATVALGLTVAPEAALLSAQYLTEELMAPTLRLTTSGEAVALKNALLTRLDRDGLRQSFERDLAALKGQLRIQYELTHAWLSALVAAGDEQMRAMAPSLGEAVALLLTEGALDRQMTSATISAEVTGLLGQHPRLSGRNLSIRLDEFTERLSRFIEVRLPGYQAYQQERGRVLAAARAQLKLEQFKPLVLTSFVRNQLINDVYLPLVGANLAKQLGAVGAAKRTDLMGMLLLISPPGYGKTTLMEYVASRLGLTFVKINGPALGHAVKSLDPAECQSATARQEVERINLSFEMGNNVMLYLDDIQHTNPELLQKFISLCDAQRKVEGVYRGQTKTYDLRGKKFCVVMAGNPYTESGQRFKIPDMLANRADTYNLGDILEGKEAVFAQSYIENALTSNTTLAPLAGRDLKDLYLLLRMARGEQVPSNELSYGYSPAEVNDLTAVLKHLFGAQEVMLKVNQQYILSASQEEAYRTEPRFQLQGSYRNMNKVAEKIFPAMNPAEVRAVLDDHYQNEAQTLTTGAEHNLLKLAELRGIMTDTQRQRWAEIKKSFQRLLVMGDTEKDPVSRVTGQLSVLGNQLEGIKKALAAAGTGGGVAQRLEGIKHALDDSIKSSTASEKLQTRIDNWLAKNLEELQKGIGDLASRKVELTLKNEPPPGIEALIHAHIETIEKTLRPLVELTTKNIQDSNAMTFHLAGLVREARGMKGEEPGKP